LGAKGQPPMPPVEASIIVTPASIAAAALARPVFLVLCRCVLSGILGANSLISEKVFLT